MKRNKPLIFLFLVLMLLLGLSIGGSITTFIFFLEKSDHLLAIIAYALLALFTLLIIITTFLFFQYKDKLFVLAKGDENYEEQ